MAVSPLGQRTQLRDAAASHIREMIVAGLARPGELLRLAPLAERIGASATPVREALLLLAQDGWVIQEPNRGFRVAGMRRKDIDDAYLVHSWVAGELAARAAVNASRSSILRLRELDAEIKALDVRDEIREELVNYQLHEEIYAMADSPRLVLFVTAASRFVPRRYWARIPGWSELNRTQHESIINALEAHDPDRAGSLMASHVNAAGQLLLAQLDSVSFWTTAALA